MILRTLYAITNAWHYRKILKKYVLEPQLQIANVIELKPEQLLQQNINALVLDFDGVLAAHGEP